MKIRYENKFRDVLAFNLFMSTRSPLLHAMHLAVFVSATLLAWKVSPALDSPMLISEAVRFIASATIGAAVLVLFFAFYLSVAALAAALMKCDSLLAERAVTLGTDAVSEESFWLRTQFRWNSVRKISRTRRYIFLFIAQYGALVIPRRAFQTGTQWELFYEVCRGKAGTPALQ